MGVTVAGWALTVGVVLALFSLDLVLATIRPHAVGYREAAAWSAFYIAVAVIFGLHHSGQPDQVSARFRRPRARGNRHRRAAPGGPG